MSKKILNIILLGPAGSGKGTQAEFLIKKYNLQKIEAGELVRQKAKENSELGKKVHKIHKSGRHCPDKIMLGLVQEAFRKIKTKRGILVDGYPRTIGQARDLDKLMNNSRIQGEIYAIWINVGNKESLRRLLNRSACSRCKTVFAGRNKKKCPKCSGEIVVRDYDIDGVAIRKRLSWFDEKVMPAIEYYREKDMLIKVNGEQPVKKVFKDILKKLKI